MTCLNYTASNNASPPIQRKACTKRRLVQGVGINDHPAPVKVNGKHIKAYVIWRDMLTRCYSSNARKKDPTYTDCTVSKDWQLFSNFERWFTGHYVEGWAIDKDILFPGNKVYSAATCVFVPQAINNLLMDCMSARGACPLGVHFVKESNKYRAMVHTGSGRKHLGYFTTPLAAHRVYQLAKADSIDAAETNDPCVRAAFDRRAAQLRDDCANNRITVKL